MWAIIKLEFAGCNLKPYPILKSESKEVHLASDRWLIYSTIPTNQKAFSTPNYFQIHNVDDIFKPLDANQMSKKLLEYEVKLQYVVFSLPNVCYPSRAWKQIQH